MRPAALVSMVGLLALAGAAGWYLIDGADRPGWPAGQTSSSSAATVGAGVVAPSQPSASAVASHTAGSGTTATQRPTDAQASGRFDDPTEFATTPGTTTLPPELDHDDVEIDPQTGVMTVRQLPSEAPPMQQPTEVLGPRDLPPGDVEIDPQTGQMTLKRYQQ